MSSLLRESLTHVARAPEYFTSDETSVRHAALELRLAIERAAYRFLPLYSDELTDDILKGWSWQPKRVIDAIVECNPLAESATTVVAGFAERLAATTRGSHPELPVKLFRRNYDKLGSLVHADPRGRRPDIASSLAFLSSTADDIEAFCRAVTILVNGVKPGVTIKCECCRSFRRTVAAVRANPVVSCPAQLCGAVYDVEVTLDGNSVMITRHAEPFACPQCQTLIQVPWAALPLSFSCTNCSRQFTVDEGIYVRAETQLE